MQSIIIDTNYSSDTIDSSVIYNTDINFSYITQPTSIDNGGWSCQAQANVTYITDDNLNDDLMVKVTQVMKSNYSRALPDMGINSYNIDNFQDVSGNSFSIPIEYRISTTYSESGEEQQSWQASIVDASNMLAVIAAVEDRIQRNRILEGENKKRREDEEVKRASYQDELEAERQDRNIEDAMAADAYYESDTESYDDEEVVVEDVTEDEVTY